MYRNGKAIITILSGGGFDENRNPIQKTEKELSPILCFLDQALPNQPIYSPDGNKVEDSSATIFFDKGALADIPLTVGTKIRVESLQNNGVMFNGTIKSYSKDDLFHDRIWV
jgi:hypothetical protein